MSDDQEPEPTEEEVRAAAELARALDAKDDPAPGSDAAYAAALRATIDRAATTSHAGAVERALARGARASRARTRGRWLVAAAALLAISVPIGWTISHDAREVAAASVVFGGPTDAIFGAPFEDGQRASERLDRIAQTRAHDYFAALAAAEAP